MNSDTYVEDQKLDHVRLVCSSAHCTATKLDINGKKHLVHKTICLEPYVFKSGLRQWFMNPEFAESEVMNEKGKCKKCGCNWTMHMATDWETVEKKKSTDKEIENESVSEEEEVPAPLKITPSGNAPIRIQNYNEPPPKSMKRSQSHRHSNHLHEPEEAKRDEKAKSEEKSVQQFTDEPKLIEVPVEMRDDDEPKLNSKKVTRSKTTSVNSNQLPKSEGRRKTTEVDVSNLLKTQENDIPLGDSAQLKESIPSKKAVRSKTTSVDTNQLPKKQNGIDIKRPERPKTTEVDGENLPKMDKNELKTKKQDKSRSPSENQTEEPNKPKHGRIKFKTTSVTTQDLPNIDPSPIQSNAAKSPKFKTMGVDPAHLQPNTSNDENRVESVEEGQKTPNEGKPKRRSIRFKFFGSDEKNEEKPKSGSPPKSPSKSPTKLKKFDKWLSPKSSDSSLKPPESPTKIAKKHKFADEFDEISEVLQSKAEDYTSSTKLLRFSDIIHIVDKQKEENEDGEEKENLHDDASTIYTNVDKNSVVDLKFDRLPVRSESNEHNSSFRKMGRALNRPEPSALINKIEPNEKLSNGEVASEKTPKFQQKSTSNGQKWLKSKEKPPPKNANQQKPQKVSTVKFGQHDDLTLASSTITRASAKKPAKPNAKANLGHKQNGHLPSSYLNNEHPTEEEVAEMNRELQCADDDAEALVEDQMDTRSEKCRRWLIDNSLAPPQRPEKFLQRLKKLVIRAGTRLKNRFGGSREERKIDI